MQTDVYTSPKEWEKLNQKYCEAETKRYFTQGEEYASKVKERFHFLKLFTAIFPDNSDKEYKNAFIDGLIAELLKTKEEEW